MTSALDAGMNPWAGGFPKGWRTARLKWVTQLINEKTELNDRPYLGLENVESGTGRWLPSKGEVEPEGLANLFERHDVLFGKLRPYLAKVYMAEGPGRCTSEMLVLRPHEVLPEFLRFVLLADETIKLVDSSTDGVKMPRAERDFVARLVVPVPEKERQRAVAAFLNRKTAAIDDLVAKKERLIELLQEKRQALITQAVTKGLDPNVPMKDSGIRWLGDIPAHWEVHQLRRVVREFVDYRGRTPTKLDEGVPLITAGAVRDGRIDHERAPEYMAVDEYKEFMRRGLPELGDLVFTSEAPLGEVALVEDPTVAFAQRIILFRVNRARVLSEFLWLYYRSDAGRSEVVSRSSGSTAEGIRADRLRGSLVPVPPLGEQSDIIETVKKGLEHLGPISKAVDVQIDRLREYRQALISAAVTGKIEIPAEEAP